MVMIIYSFSIKHCLLCCMPCYTWFSNSHSPERFFRSRTSASVYGTLNKAIWTWSLHVPFHLVALHRQQRPRMTTTVTHPFNLPTFLRKKRSLTASITRKATQRDTIPLDSSPTQPTSDPSQLNAAKVRKLIISVPFHSPWYIPDELDLPPSVWPWCFPGPPWKC